MRASVVLVLAAVLLFSCSASSADKTVHEAFVSRARAAAQLRIKNVGAALNNTDPPRKMLAGPPSEFASMSLPLPIAGALAEDSCAADIMFAEVAGSALPTFEYTADILVDSTEAWTLTVFVPVPAGATLNTELLDPNGKPVDLASNAHAGRFPIGGLSIPETTYLFTKDVVPGSYTIKISIATSAATPASELVRLRATASGAHGTTLVWNKSELQVHTYLTTYTLVTDTAVGLIASMTDKAVVEGQVPTALKEVILSAEIDVTLPDGRESIIPMHDDGSGNGDFVAGDGIFAGSFQAAEVGNYVMRGVVEGVLADGTKFRRSTEHLMPVTSLEVQLDGTATASWGSNLVAGGNDALDIVVNVAPRAVMQRINRKFRAYAEVYGTSLADKTTMVPVAWISEMVNVLALETGELAFKLTLDGAWISAAKAAAPFELHNVVLQDSANYIPETELAVIKISLPNPTDVHRTLIMAHRHVSRDNITLEMRQGVNPIPKPVKADKKDGIVLLHGYCAETNPWEKFTAWENPYFFLNPKASIGNDEFALKVVDFVENNDLDTFGLIGHSQGGLVSTHLMNYYFSGLDHAEGSARVQSVGSPYQGCSAAGSIANLGKTFGVGCGENLDLSKDSAQLWAAGISAQTKTQLFYYTTTYKLNNFFGDWCSLPMNAILNYPNDGTTELDQANLEGANNMGNTEKQCHTTEMGYPPQYWDETRNAKINEAAAR